MPLSDPVQIVNHPLPSFPLLIQLPLQRLDALLKVTRQDGALRLGDLVQRGVLSLQRLEFLVVFGGELAVELFLGRDNAAEVDNVLGESVRVLLLGGYGGTELGDGLLELGDFTEALLEFRLHLAQAGGFGAQLADFLVHFSSTRQLAVLKNNCKILTK